MWSLSSIASAIQDHTIKSIALDSVPQSADSMLASSVEKRFPFGRSLTAKFAQLGTHPYYFEGCFRRETTCEMAKLVADRRVLLLGGLDAPDFQESTSKLSKCFPSNSTIESKTDLSPSGYSIIDASLELSESYDQRVIDFFRRSLGQPAV